jgi:hypothetical protein
MSSWGSYSINDVSAIMPYFFWNNVDDAKDKCMSILKATE